MSSKPLLNVDSKNSTSKEGKYRMPPKRGKLAREFAEGNRMDRVYIDATIPSYLVARQSNDPKVAEWQRIT